MDDPITEIAAEIVPHDGSLVDRRKELQTLNAALLERKRFKKEQMKHIKGQIDDIEEQIKSLVEQLEAEEKTL